MYVSQVCIKGLIINEILVFKVCPESWIIGPPPTLRQELQPIQVLHAPQEQGNTSTRIF